jgi:hypothetical protein
VNGLNASDTQHLDSPEEGNAELKLPIGTLLATAKRDFARSRDPAPPSLSTRDNDRHSSQNVTGNVMARELDP